MSVHTRERDRRPGFDGVKIKFYYYYNIFLKNVLSTNVYIMNVFVYHSSNQSPFLI